MNKLTLYMAAVALSLTACTDAPTADKATTTDAQAETAASGTVYAMDKNQSSLIWTGTKPTGQHKGTFTFDQGNLTVDNGAITGGNFVANIKSMKLIEEDEETQTKLGGHLLGPDFFHADSFSTAAFAITGVKAGAEASAGEDLLLKDATHTITGNLTLKGITKSITFPAKVAMADNAVTADANFNIDRTLWGMNYKSDKSFGDKIIHPTVNINLHLVAAK